jgi:hypothetical protein
MSIAEDREDIRADSWSSVREEKASILEQLDPRITIENYTLSLQGLQVSYRPDGVKNVRKVIKRQSPSNYTIEFVKGLERLLNTFLNFTTQATRLDEKKIVIKMRNNGLAILEYFCIDGSKHYISQAVWAKMMEIHDCKFKDQDGEIQSGWHHIGIPWKYDSPITYDMVKLVKLTYNIPDDYDNVSEINQQFQSLLVLLEASLRKSWSGENNQLGMLVSLLGETRREVMSQRDSMTPLKGGKIPRDDEDKWQ